MTRVFILFLFVAILFPYDRGLTETNSSNLYLRAVVFPEAYVSMNYSTLSANKMQDVNLLTNAPEDFKVEIKSKRGQLIPLLNRNLFFLMHENLKRHETVVVTISKI